MKKHLYVSLCLIGILTLLHSCQQTESKKQPQYIAAWKYLDFGSGADKMSIQVKSELGGEIIVRADTKDGDILGTFTIPANTDWKVYETTIKETSGIHALWMEYKGTESLKNELFRIEHFTFTH